MGDTSRDVVWAGPHKMSGTSELLLALDASSVMSNHTLVFEADGPHKTDSL